MFEKLLGRVARMFEKLLGRVARMFVENSTESHRYLWIKTAVDRFLRTAFSDARETSRTPRWVCQLAGSLRPGMGRLAA